MLEIRFCVENEGGGTLNHSYGVPVLVVVLCYVMGRVAATDDYGFLVKTVGGSGAGVLRGMDEAGTGEDGEAGC